MHLLVHPMHQKHNFACASADRIGPDDGPAPRLLAWPAPCPRAAGDLRLNSAARPSAVPLPPFGVETLWPLCLDLARLRREGDATSWEATRQALRCGPWDADAARLHDLLAPLLDRPPGGAPWAIGQLGQSLDGHIATRDGDACFINGPEGLAHLHRLRALCDAVLVGAGTVAHDDPQLTTRRVPGPHPVRVVIDPGLGLPPETRVFRDGRAPTLLACDATRRAEAAARVGAHQVLAVPGLDAGPGAPPRLPALVEALRARGLHVLFVEGGGVTVSRFVQQGCLQRLHLMVAPVVIGDGRPGLQLPRAATMGDALRPPCRTFAMGADVLWDLDLADAH